MTQKRKSLTPKSNKPAAETERRKSLVESDWTALKGAAKLLDDENLSATHQELIEKSVETFEALIAFKEEQDKAKAKKPVSTPTSKTSKAIAAKKGKATRSTTKKTTTVLPRLRSSTSPKSKVVEVPKRKAGRPKKSTTEAPKKKAGRPKKIADSGSKKEAEAEKDTEKVYVVEKILDRKGGRGRYSYKVKWRGYKRATWVDRSDFVDLGLPDAFDKSRAASSK